MFTVVNLERPHSIAFKCTPETFGELVERPGIIPAPYMARNMWVQEQELGEVLDRTGARGADQNIVRAWWSRSSPSGGSPAPRRSVTPRSNTQASQRLGRGRARLAFCTTFAVKERKAVSETLSAVPAADSRAPMDSLYEARACGSVLSVNTWQGWIEFVPVGGGEPVRSPRETTQPNRTDTEDWATGLTDVYLEGALRRALEPPLAVPRATAAVRVFASGGVDRVTTADAAPTSILDPFSVFEKGEPCCDGSWVRSRRGTS